MNRRAKPQGTEYLGIWYPRAGTGQRWWARIIDATVIVGAGAVGGAAYLVSQPVPSSSESIGLAVVCALVFQTFVAMVLGFLYGRGVGLGQAITGCKSRRTRDGRFVGGFRGWMRYWAILFFPLLVFFLIFSLFDGAGSPSSLWSDGVIACKRRGVRSGQAASNFDRVGW